MRVAVIGASLAGLFAAAAAAANGADTVILERDELPKTPEPRKGVPQGRQAHVLLHRGLLSAEELLPGLRDDLIAHGAARFDSGAMPWLGEYGWLPTWWPGFELVSVTRPLLEHLARQRLISQSAVTVHEGARVSGLRRSGRQWQVITEDGRTFVADRLIDGSGRSSRLPHCLAELGIRVPEPAQVDAHLGYASRLYRANGRPPLETGVLIAGTPATGRGAIALPVENGHWLVIAGGYGDHRPTREPEEFDAYLAALRDPAVADVAARLEPIGDIALYRQTSNRRHWFGRVRGWPEGLLVVGDAACAFNPVYGQGITVAAQQALLIRDRWHARRLQRSLDRVADFCWTVASGEDVRHPTSEGQQNMGQRVLARWSMELGHQAVAGNQRAYRTFLLTYNLMARPLVLFHPALFLAAARAAIRGRGAPAPRPEVLEALRPSTEGGDPSGVWHAGDMHILVVDDDQAVRDSLKRSLEYNSYDVTTAEDGVQALARLAAVRPDAVIMDVMMPRLDGLETTRMLRAAGNDVPILVLTARDAVGDRVDGLDAGGDDYMAKPFALDELLARLRALVRRAGTVADSADPSAHNLTFSDLVLNPQTREVLRGTRPINLTRTEFALLEAFMAHPRRVLERSWLLNEVWGFDFPTTANSLEVYIGYVRRKTEAEQESRLIHTVRGVGYVLRETPP